jgi:hypothetical protein
MITHVQPYFETWLLKPFTRFKSVAKEMMFLYLFILDWGLYVSWSCFVKVI